MLNPYFSSIKDTPVRTGLYTPSLPLGWDTFSEWINPQKKSVSNVKKSQSKTVKKSHSISSKSAKKAAVSLPLPETPAIKLPVFFKISILCTAILIGLFFYETKNK